MSVVGVILKLYFMLQNLTENGNDKQGTSFIYVQGIKDLKNFRFLL